MNEVWITIGKVLNGAWFYDNVGNIFNYIFIVVGAFGFIRWMMWQRNFNKKAEENPNQIK